ncbi:unnamed protein product [Phyllotreta striolata]|uniref:Uncharacterized protein n=1 Tax=Phyllotreta striolata TaxID=444603 RepID=A0A9N9XQG8_PHYSR|nr:unnamed protein product [Phyllotreta striolata]
MKILVVFCVLMVAVSADTWTTLDKHDCQSSCVNNCQRENYKYGECINQGGLFPKFADCHCWHKDYNYKKDNENYYRPYNY